MKECHLLLGLKATFDNLLRRAFFFFFLQHIAFCSLVFIKDHLGKAASYPKMTSL